MSWLSKATGIHISPHGAHVNLGELKSGLGNLAKNLSPALAFTPLGLAGTAIASGVGDLARGKNIGEAALGAAKNAAIGAGARGASGLIQRAIGQGAPSVPGAASAVSHGGLPLPNVPDLTSVTKTPGFLGKVGGFIEAHPTATAMGLQSLGNVATAGAQNRAANAQATLLEQQAADNEYERQRQRTRDLELAPLYGRLGTALGQTLSRPVAGNPYVRA